MDKSPFVVVQNFISPLVCEDIINRLGHTFPNEVKDVPVKTVNFNKLTELRLLPSLEELIESHLESYYGFELKGIFPFEHEWFVEGFALEKPRTENEALIDGNWMRVDEKDFTGVIFLNDYNDATPFDPTYEVYGGKLEFPNHQFGFNPKRGTMVIFPSDHRFANSTSKIHAGELNQIRFHICAKVPYEYDIKKFPGTYKTWFS